MYNSKAGEIAFIPAYREVIVFTMSVGEEMPYASIMWMPLLVKNAVLYPDKTLYKKVTAAVKAYITKGDQSGFYTRDASKIDVFLHS